MAKPLDYSVWDHIEVSDDEDDTHPNVDTPSLFKWRHEARVERMQEAEKEKRAFQQGKDSHQTKMTQMKQKLKEAETQAAADDLNKLKLELSEMEKQEEQFRKKEDELKQKDKSTPWNIDTLCKDGKSKTIINKATSVKRAAMTDEEKADKQVVFTEQYEKEMKKYGMMKRYDDSQEYLMEHPHLTCEETANFLVLWCVNLQVEEKISLMEHVSHQAIVMQFILELARSLDMDPRSCIKGFFSRIKMAEKQYTDAFNDELEAFKGRVRARAQARLEEAMKQVEEEEREQRLGPGGLDPMEVYETLPAELQQCFDSKDIGMLQKVILNLSKEDAEYYMRRCVDSGLWVPNAKDAEEMSRAGEGEDEEKFYDAISDKDEEKK